MGFVRRATVVVLAVVAAVVESVARSPHNDSSLGGCEIPARVTHRVEHRSLREHRVLDVDLELQSRLLPGTVCLRRRLLLDGSRQANEGLSGPPLPGLVLVVARPPNTRNLLKAREARALELLYDPLRACRRRLLSALAPVQVGQILLVLHGALVADGAGSEDVCGRDKRLLGRGAQPAVIVHRDNLVHAEAAALEGINAGVVAAVPRVKLAEVVLVAEVRVVAGPVSGVELLKRRAIQLPDGVLVVVPGVKQEGLGEGFGFDRGLALTLHLGVLGPVGVILDAVRDDALEGGDERSRRRLAANLNLIGVPGDVGNVADAILGHGQDEREREGLDPRAVGEVRVVVEHRRLLVRVVWVLIRVVVRVVSPRLPALLHDLLDPLLCLQLPLLRLLRLNLDLRHVVVVARVNHDDIRRGLRKAVSHQHVVGLRGIVQLRGPRVCAPVFQVVARERVLVYG